MIIKNIYFITVTEYFVDKNFFPFISCFFFYENFLIFDKSFFLLIKEKYQFCLLKTLFINNIHISYKHILFLFLNLSPTSLVFLHIIVLLIKLCLILRNNCGTEIQGAINILIYQVDLFIANDKNIKLQNLFLKTTKKRQSSKKRLSNFSKSKNYLVVALKRFFNVHMTSKYRS